MCVCIIAYKITVGTFLNGNRGRIYVEAMILGGGGLGVEEGEEINCVWEVLHERR